MRVYDIDLNLSTAITTSLDIFEIVPAADKPVVILGWEIGQTSEIGDAGEEMLEMLFKRMVTITSGSVGVTAPTPRPVLQNDAASAFTIEVGNTTKATATTAQALKRFSWNVRMSHLWVPVPEDRPVVAGTGNGFVLELVSTPADSITKIVGSLTVAELV